MIMLIVFLRVFFFFKLFGVDFFIRELVELVKFSKEELVEIWLRGEEFVKVLFVRYLDYNDFILVFFDIGILDELFICCGFNFYILFCFMLGSIICDFSEMFIKF